MKSVAQVVLPIALSKNFDYSFSRKLKVAPGSRVLVDFAGRRRVAIVVSVSETSTFGHLKPILDAGPCLNKEHIRFAQRLTKLYPYNIGEFLYMMIPAYLKDPRKLTLTPASAKTTKRTVAAKTHFIKAATFSQRYRFWKDTVREKLRQGSVLIIFPQVTYLEEAKKIMDKDFPGEIAVFTSQRSKVRLFKDWQRSRANTLILATRVGLFFYPTDIELIVIEEENSRYYFQEEKPFYHLVDAASELAKLKKLELLLCGDFPSLVTYKAIKEKKISFKEEKDKAETKIEVIGAKVLGGKGRTIAPLVEDLVRKNLDENKRVLILWNKKRFVRAISCSVCDYVFSCQRCSGLLQQSLKDKRGICPYCGRTTEVPQICPHCNKGYLKGTGFGIERIEGILRGSFPEAEITEWQGRKPTSQIVLSTSKILSSLYDKETFGAGFLLDLDHRLCRLDYQATIDAFLYLKKISLFITDTLYIFTRHKDHYLFRALSGTWCDFYEKELSLRKELKLPPFGTISQIILRGPKQNILFKKSQDLYNRLSAKGLDIYGPLEENPFKLRGCFRYALVVKSRGSGGLGKIVEEEFRSLRRSHLKVAAVIRTR